MFVISQDASDVMHEIDGAYVRVSFVGFVSHAVCPLTEDFELFGCHSLEFFYVVKVTHDFDWYVVVVTSHGVLPRFHFTCIGFLDVFETVNNCFVHVLEILS